MRLLWEGRFLLLKLGLLLLYHELLLIVWYLLDEDAVADWSLLILFLLHFNVHPFFFLNFLVLFLQLNPTQLLLILFQLFHRNSQNMFNQLILFIFFQLLQKSQIQITQSFTSLLCWQILPVMEICLALVIFCNRVNQSD